MRSALCDFFIHGRGGGVYDRVTEKWWHHWQGEALAPTAVVSADVTMPFDVPTATRGDVAAARWQCHHLPHNLDRALGLDGPLVREKYRLIEQVARDDAPWRRWLGFCAIHRINAALAVQHPEVVAAAKQRRAEAEQGLANSAVAARRDWCFALYDAATLERLNDRIRAGK
jgi:hypothetical protein